MRLRREMFNRLPAIRMRRFFAGRLRLNSCHRFLKILVTLRAAYISDFSNIVIASSMFVMTTRTALLIDYRMLTDMPERFLMAGRATCFGFELGSGNGIEETADMLISNWIEGFMADFALMFPSRMSLTNLSMIGRPFDKS